MLFGQLFSLKQKVKCSIKYLNVGHMNKIKIKEVFSKRIRFTIQGLGHFLDLFSIFVRDMKMRTIL